MRKTLREVAGGRSGQVRVERYKRRNWAVYDRYGLVAVTVYRCGARAVADRLRGRTRPAKRGRGQRWN